MKFEFFFNNSNESIFANFVSESALVDICNDTTQLFAESDDGKFINLFNVDYIKSIYGE